MEGPYIIGGGCVCVWVCIATHRRQAHTRRQMMVACLWFPWGIRMHSMRNEKDPTCLLPWIPLRAPRYTLYAPTIRKPQPIRASARLSWGLRPLRKVDTTRGGQRLWGWTGGYRGRAGSVWMGCAAAPSRMLCTAYRRAGGTWLEYRQEGIERGEGKCVMNIKDNLLGISDSISLARS